MAEALQVHVFGGRIGECILLGLPGGRWAVIDIYLEDLADPGESPIIRFLQERGIKELEFFCLTHPHNDHVKGASYLLRNYRILRFLGFGASSPSESYNRIVKILKTKARRLHDNAQEEAIASDLLEALADVNAKVTNKQMVLDPVTVNYTALDEIAGPEKLRLRMVAVAPSGRSVGVYNEQLNACFDKTTRGKILADKIEGVAHNEISSGFVLEYGTQRVILGGDVESPGWQDILQRPEPGFNLRADLVKVSHHGSENGYCPELWEKYLSPQQEATAILTAFSPKGLPRPEGIAHLKRNTKRLVTTSLSSLKPKIASPPSSSPFTEISFDAQMLLSTVFKNASRISNAIGVCSFTFDGGAQIAEGLSGDAGAIS